MPPTGGLRDKVIHIDTSFSLGFGKPTSTFVFGSSDRAFGWPGAGGSFGFADPDTGIGFGYVMNRMGIHLFSDPRELAPASSPVPRRAREQTAALNGQPRSSSMTALKSLSAWSAANLA